MLRVFAPPEDRVRDIFYGSQGGGTQARKARELEKKRAYAAELQTQMQERERQKQLERMHRLGIPPAGAAVPANFAAPPPGAAISDAAGWPPSAAARPSNASPYNSGGIPTIFQQQQQQQPSWQSPTSAAPTAALSQGSGSYAAQSSMQAGAASVQSPYSIEAQQQLLQSLAAWPDAAAAAANAQAGNGPPYIQQQPKQQGFVGPGAAAGMNPASYAAAARFQPQQPPYAQMSVAAQPEFSSGSPGAACYGSPVYGSSYPVGAAGARQSMGAAALTTQYQPWGGQSPADAGYAASPPLGHQQAGMGTIGSSMDSAGYAPAGSPARGSSYWASGISNQAWGQGPTTSAAAGPDPKVLQVKAKKDAYRAELEAQIRDKAARKAAEKSALRAEDLRKEAEMVGFNPWGRGGGGAPLRDAAGQVVSDLRGKNVTQREPQQQMQQMQQYQNAAHAYASSGAAAAADPSTAVPAGAACCWGEQDDQLQDRYRQQPQQQHSTAAAAGPAAAPGAPPLLCFRSDKAFMTADEVERRQQAQVQLQKELDQQIQEKKRRKEMEQRAAEEEARCEEQRLAAEQARLAAQFESEQMKEKSKARLNEDVEEQVAGAWTAAKQAAQQERRKTMDERRRSMALPADDDSNGNFQQSLSGQQQDRQFGSQFGSSHSSNINSSTGGPHQQQQPDMLQFQVQQRQQQQQMDQKQRQDLMMEALRLEEDKMRSMAAQEVERLRSEMEAQANALRDVVERQGGEVAALRAAAAAAEAESLAAKTELMQVRRDFMRKSQELQHETLTTILADYGDGPVSAIAAAYHPAPIRHIDIDLPAPAAALRRSVQAKTGGAATVHACTDAGQYVSGLTGGTSAVDLLESMLQQGRQAPTGSMGRAAATTDLSAAAADVNSSNSWGLGTGRSSSLPTGTAGPNWLHSLNVNAATNNVRNSMLVSESTFIFPSGFAAPPAAVDEDGNIIAASTEQNADMDAATAAAAKNVGLEGSSWWQQPMELQQQQQQQQQLPHFQRQTSSAPGPRARANKAVPGAVLHSSLSAGRHGLVTPGGSDLTAVVNRNADRLQLLSSLPPASDPEALDEFLSKFVSKSSQPNQRSVATPPSRLLTPPTGSLLGKHPSQGRPPRYSNTTADIAAPADSHMYLGIQDTLDKELNKLNVGASGSSAAAAVAQQRLLAVGIGAAAADGSSAAAKQVEASDASMLGTSHWLPQNGPTQLL